MEASVDPQCRGPDWMPITPKTGSLFHAETQAAEAALEFLRSSLHALHLFLSIVLAPRPPHLAFIARVPKRLAYA